MSFSSTLSVANCREYGPWTVKAYGVRYIFFLFCIFEPSKLELIEVHTACIRRVRVVLLLCRRDYGGGDVFIDPVRSSLCTETTARSQN
jgi:hypothetical protein